MLRNIVVPPTLVTLVAVALAVFSIVGVFAAALWLIRLATPRNQVADYAQRIQGPQEAPESHRVRE